MHNERFAEINISLNTYVQSEAWKSNIEFEINLYELNRAFDKEVRVVQTNKATVAEHIIWSVVFNIKWK